MIIIRKAIIEWIVSGETYHYYYGGETSIAADVFCEGRVSSAVVVSIRTRRGCCLWRRPKLSLLRVNRRHMGCGWKKKSISIICNITSIIIGGRVSFIIYTDWIGLRDVYWRGRDEEKINPERKNKRLSLREIILYVKNQSRFSAYKLVPL